MHNAYNFPHAQGEYFQKKGKLIIHYKKVAILLYFVAFFHVASLSSTGVDNKKVGVDNEKALELDNRIFFFIVQPDFNIEISSKNATKHPVA